MKRIPKRRSWAKMTAAELARATTQFDKPIRFEDSRPLTPGERERFERARRAGGPGIDGIQALGLDARLLKAARAYAKRKKLTMAQLVERGLRRELAVSH